jgi:superoxide dismutase
MRLHHDKHHRAYVTNINAAVANYSSAPSLADQIALQSAINFNGGGHINHSLFWENLSPASSPDAKADAAPALVAELTRIWGGLDQFKAAFNTALLGITGSGWGWLVKDDVTGLSIVTTKDQDPVTKGVPVFGVDMWEHAYYLQVRFRSHHSWCFLVTDHTTVPQRQGCLRGEHLERSQLEDCRGSLQRRSRGCLQGAQGDPLSDEWGQQHANIHDDMRP